MFPNAWCATLTSKNGSLLSSNALLCQQGTAFLKTNHWIAVDPSKTHRPRRKAQDRNSIPMTSFYLRATFEKKSRPLRGKSPPPSRLSHAQIPPLLRVSTPTARSLPPPGWTVPRMRKNVTRARHLANVEHVKRPASLCMRNQYFFCNDVRFQCYWAQVETPV